MQKKKIIIIMGREDPVKDLGGSGLTFYTFTPIGWDYPRGDDDDPISWNFDKL